MKRILCAITIITLILSTLVGCGNSNEDSKLWVVSYYEDEFKEPTDECYITNSKYIKGTFSNTATTDSELYVQILVDKSCFSIKLLEYEKNIVENSSASKAVNYTITVKYDDGEKSKFYADMQPGDDKITLESPYGYYFANKLKENQSISFYIVESKRTTTNYLFSVTSENFSEIYDEQFSIDSETPTANTSVTTIDKVRNSYNAALSLAESNNKNQDYSYLLLRDEVVSLNNMDSFDQAKAEVVFKNVSNENIKQKCSDLLTYVIAEDQDYISALMRKLSTVKSVAGTIETTSVNIQVDDIDDLLNELEIQAETLGRILAMLDIYDYSWLSDNEDDKFLQFTDNGFTYNWKSSANYILDLNYQAAALDKNDFIIDIRDTNETIDTIEFLNANYPQGGFLSLYDDKNYENGTAQENTYDKVYTKRGVTVGSSLDLVFSSYGQTSIQSADENSVLYKKIVSDTDDDYRKNLFLFQSDCYVVYEYKNDCRIYFAFDSSKNVSWIIYSTVKL